MAILNLTEETYDSVIAQGTPVFVEFWTVWCPPCRITEGILTELSEELGDLITVARIDADTYRNVADANGVMSVPTFIFYENGEEVRRQSGAMTKESMLAFLNPEPGEAPPL